MIFYNKYKKFRIENNIDLKDISKRTKVDLKYLNALERGKFAEIPPVYVKLFFKAYIYEIGVDIDEALFELDSFLNQKSNNKTLKFIPEEQNKSFNFFKKINSENLFNYSVLIGISSFLLILFLSYTLNSSSQISEEDIKNELRITKSDLIEYYSLKSEEVLSIESISNPVMIRFESKIENYIYDDFSGKEYFIFEDSVNSKSNTVQWNGEEKYFLIANTVDYKLILYSKDSDPDSFQDFSKDVINDFPVEVVLKSDPQRITVKKYLPKN